jgi:hypothetical protein
LPFIGVVAEFRQPSSVAALAAIVPVAANIDCADLELALFAASSRLQ